MLIKIMLFFMYFFIILEHTNNEGDIMNKLRKIFIIFITYIIIPLNVFAYSDYIIASGKNIGIELHSKGVMVVGLYKIGNTYPGGDAGIEAGDIIVSINDSDVNNVDELVNIVNNIKVDNINITYLRGNILNYTNLKLYKDNNIVKTGLYVRDSISGIGTLTFIDPNSKIFGALGHEINDSTTGNKIEIKDGILYPSRVVGIDKSINGNPGGKNARYNSSNVIGDIYENTIHGVFGIYNEEVDTNNLYKVASADDIKKGEAKILTVIEGDKVEEFSINILKVNDKISTKNIVFEITDKRLLDKTGGIIQGMSGSPIVQDNYIVGAVTHVMVDNPKRGYGILITNMLEEGEN